MVRRSSGATRTVRPLSPGGGRPPRLPRIVLTRERDLSPRQPAGFLRLERHEYRAHYPNGEISSPFTYDSVDRGALDAVVMLAHFKRGTVRHIFLRSAIRPPLVSRNSRRGPTEGKVVQGGLWELPAGLVEPGEQRPLGSRRSAQRELEEEVGLHVKLSVLRALGPATFPAPAVIAEQHHFFEAEVDPTTQFEPSLDGSALEHQGRVINPPLAQALAWCERGAIRDAKTELGLRRLWERYGG